MVNKVYVFANMGHLDQLPKSGGQTSARRVMQGFKDEGIEIVPIRRHRAELQSKIGHVAEISFFAFYDWFKMIAKMLFGKRKNAAFMQMTYAGALVPYELLLSATARVLGYKSMEYLQGGLVMDTYPKGGKIHKWLYKKNMEMQSAVCFEGYDALKLTESVTTKPELIYLPSYVFDDKIPAQVPMKPKDEINFCFFGRIGKPKNVLISIEIYNQFCAAHPEMKTSLTIVGSGENKEYLQKVDDAVKNSPFSSTIKQYGNSPYDFLVEMMQKQHFYLFPTEEKAEGHSNALNEAMSQGLIPIASDYHFNKTIIGDEWLVVSGYNPKDYTNKIEWVVKNCNLSDLSKKMWARVKDNFAYSLVNKGVCDALKKI